MLRTLVMFALMPLGWIAAMSPGARAQDSAAAAKPEFEVVSIRQNIGADEDGSWGVTLNEYHADNTPLGRVILQAYTGQISPSIDRLKNAPSWVMDDRYDITAKVDDTVANSWKGLRQEQQVRLAAPLLRTMLEERCKLVVHTVPTMINGYALVVGKHGIKMKVSTPDEPPVAGAVMLESGARMVLIPPDPDAKQAVVVQNGTLAELLHLFSASGTPYVDQTALTAKYDFELPRFALPPPESGAEGVDRPRPDGAHRYDWSALGLEMKPIKVPAVEIVVDSIERPSRN